MHSLSKVPTDGDSYQVPVLVCCATVLRHALWGDALGGGGVDFYQVVDQVIELLRHRGRVSYRALQRQFGLDDAYLEDLKAELIVAQRLAVDEHGQVLIWTGGATSTLPLQAVSATPPNPPLSP